jgi:hypothetical protein
MIRALTRITIEEQGSAGHTPYPTTTGGSDYSEGVQGSTLVQVQTERSCSGARTRARFERSVCGGSTASVHPEGVSCTEPPSVEAVSFLSTQRNACLGRGRFNDYGCAGSVPPSF